MSNRRARSSRTVEQISRQRQKPIGNLGQSEICHKLDGRGGSRVGVELDQLVKTRESLTKWSKEVRSGLAAGAHYYLHLAAYEGLETQLGADVLDDEPMARRNLWKDDKVLPGANTLFRFVSDTPRVVDFSDRGGLCG